MAGKTGYIRTLNMIEHFFKKYTKWSNFKTLFTASDNLLYIGVLILLVELFLNIFIIEKVPYTEIDWRAYMQECEGFLNGTLNYSKLKGDTGPLVYPAGFVYIYSALYYLTNYGTNIKLAQYIFLCVYLVQLMLVLRIYKKSAKVPPYVLIICIFTSYRIHSIYVLRLFNDTIAVVLLFIALNFFIDRYWTLGSVFFSLAVSIKMNILLYAPALLLFYLINLGFIHTIKQLLYCGSIQLILGLPFLITYPVDYLKGSFDVGRVFNHTWTVNYRFLDIQVFEHKYFHLLLLFLHLLLLAIFYPIAKRYFNSFAILKYVQSKVEPQIKEKNKENEEKTRNKHKSHIKSQAKQRRMLSNKTIDNSFNEDEKKFLSHYERSLKNEDTVGYDTSKINNQNVTNFGKINQLFLLPMFLSNFIGMCCARSLHYQFYSWYFHTLPYLMWSTTYPNILKFLILALIETCWNTYPSTIFSSLLLHFCHFILLIGVYKYATKM